MFWTKDQDEITITGNRTMMHMHGNSYTLIRDPVRVRDQGPYVLNAQNSFGKDTATTEVRVTPLSPVSEVKIVEPLESPSPSWKPVTPKFDYSPSRNLIL